MSATNTTHCVQFFISDINLLLMFIYVFSYLCLIDIFKGGMIGPLDFKLSMSALGIDKIDSSRQEPSRVDEKCNALPPGDRVNSNCTTNILTRLLHSRFLNDT